MYRTVCGLTSTFTSVEEAIDETILPTNNNTITNNNTAEPKKEAKNVLKNDFIVL